MKNIVIYGSGGFGREVAFLIEEINKAEAKWNILGFVNDYECFHGEVINGYPILGGGEWITNYSNNHPLAVVIAVGSPKGKEKILNKLREAQVEFPILVHPGVIMSKHITIGRGTVICAGSILTCNINVGEFVSVMVACTIGHDVNIENYVTLLPGCKIAGNVLLKTGSDIGSNTAIIQQVEVGSYTIVGAGSTVVRNLPDHCTAVGTPAKPIKFHER